VRLLVQPAIVVVVVVVVGGSVECCKRDILVEWSASGK